MANAFDPTSISDPRTDPEFDSTHWPLCDGGESPHANTVDRIECRKIQFLAAYYRLNHFYARLRKIREGTPPEDDKQVLREIEAAIRQRDDLEDFYEPEGFIGEPVMDGIFYKDIEFTYARRREIYQPASSSKFSLFIPMPPPEANIEEWVREHVGKVFPKTFGASAPAKQADQIPAKPQEAKPES